MSFTGDLEHLSIVDVIQLLHATKKSGTLTVKGRKGESQLVFDDGYITSANHFDNSIRIGNILAETSVITHEILSEALLEQKNAGENRKPLIATLIEKGQVKKDDAYRGLETLIELTVVEILTWKRGTFTLDVDKVTVSDEYRYFPETLHQDMHLHTENVLMDALRIYDEKKRDGLLAEEDLSEDIPFEGEHIPEDAGQLLSADDLGLGDLEHLEKRIPGVFVGLEDRNPAAVHRRKIEELASGLSVREQEELLSFLGNCSSRAHAGETAYPGEGGPTVILYSPDEFMTYCITTVCRHEGIFVFASNEEQDLDPVIDQFSAKSSVPVLVIDAPDESDGRFSAAYLTNLRQQKRQRYPHLCVIQLASPLDYNFLLQSFRDGVRSVLPRPIRRERKETFVEDAIQFLQTFPTCIKAYGREQGNDPVALLGKNLATLEKLREPQEIAYTLLQSVSGIFERSLTLIVRETELIAERGIGIKAERSKGATPVLGFRIPLAQPSIFKNIIEKGILFFGTIDDEVVRDHLFKAIGTPLQPTGILLPLVNFGKTIALIYADFGGKEASPVNGRLLEILAGQAGVFLENALYRKRRERTSP